MIELLIFYLCILFCTTGQSESKRDCTECQMPRRSSLELDWAWPCVIYLFFSYCLCIQILYNALCTVPSFNFLCAVPFKLLSTILWFPCCYWLNKLLLNFHRSFVWLCGRALRLTSTFTVAILSDSARRSLHSVAHCIAVLSRCLDAIERGCGRCLRNMSSDNLWSPPAVEKLIELYCSYECLWRTSRNEYMNRNIKERVINIIKKNYWKFILRSMPKKLKKNTNHSQSVSQGQRAKQS